MGNREVSQEELENLISDITYLQDEADALTYVIDSVPYDEKPPSGRSIIETLLFIDHAQQEYYRPVIEDAYKSNRPINLNSYIKPEESFEVDEDLAKDVQKTLYKISKHRAGLINLVKNIPLIDWERTVSKGSREMTLFNFANEMVQKERATLKDIADLILSYEQNKNVHKNTISDTSTSKND